jgi:PAS domain S-box-containing protein
MPAATEFEESAHLISGEQHAALRRLLTVTCEQFGMDIAFVGVFDGFGNRTVRHSVHADGASGPTGLTEPLDATWCGRVVQDGPILVRDTRDDETLQALLPTGDLSIVSYAGAPLVDENGAVFGTLWAVGHEPRASLNPHDLDLLIGLAGVAAPLVRALEVPTTASGPRMDLDSVAAAVEDADSVERLTRPLLGALRDLTGLASAYLTVVHEGDDVQEVRYALNSRDGFEVREGLLVPWSETLCKRALLEGRPITTDVSTVWGDSEAARSLGIQVYASVPVTTSDGLVWGTLCAADSQGAEQVETHLPTMRLFARLIASEVEREEVVRAKRTLEETLDRYRSLFERNPLGVVAFDREGHFQELNAAMETLIGVNAEDLRGTPFEALVQLEDKNHTLGLFDEVLQGRPQEFEMTFTNPDGGAVDLHITTLPIVVNNEVMGAYNMVEDVTVTNALRRELQEAARVAEDANEAKSMYLANMSHELRTPLTTLLAAAEILGDSLGDQHQDQGRLISQMARAGARLDALLGNILDLSSIEAGVTSLEYSQVDVGTLILEVVEDARLAAATKKVSLTAVLGPQTPQLMSVDRAVVHQVLTNLIGNALKFTETGAIVVRAASAAREVQGVIFSVSDSGIGLSEEHQQRVFESFMQADPSITRRYGGTGLGLAICKSLVQAMRGQVWVESTLGTGSTFSVWLPLDGGRP